MKMPKMLDTIMLLFIVGLHLLAAIALAGCSSKDVVIDSMIYDQRPSNISVMVEKPPIRVIYTGPVTPEGMELTKAAIAEVQKTPYKNYHFNDAFEKKVTAGFGRKEIDSDTNTISINR